MWTELCCCSVIFIIGVIIFFRIFGRAIIVRQGQQQQAPPPQYDAPSPAMHRGDSAMEIVMTKCQNCGMMYDERLPSCPKCGGT